MQNRKIGPGSATDTIRHLDKPLDGNNRIETGPTAKAIEEWQAMGLVLPDLEKMRDYRLDRIVNELNKREFGGILLFDPVNIRYATDAPNMQIWTSRNFSRAAFISAAGHVVLWDFVRCRHLTAHLTRIDEFRESAGSFYFSHGDKETAVGERFAGELTELVRAHCGGQRLAVDKMDIHVLDAARADGLSIVSGHHVMELARSIKGPEEIRAMRCAIASCETAVAAMHEALAPGKAEVELWSILHAENIARGGEWIETRLLASGPRTNPWMAEAGPRLLEDGDLLAFDTDMVGPYGYCCDMSRTWYCGDSEPTPEQKEVFRIGVEHVTQNMELLRPGVHFRELSFGGHQLPNSYVAQRYCVKMHGVGMCDEWPSIYYPQDYIEGAFDHVLEPGMVFSVEVYAGKVGGRDGVKIENQVLITETGHENLTTYPYDEKLMG